MNWPGARLAGPAPPSARGLEEIQLVADEINRLFARLDKSLASQRRFISEPPPTSCARRSPPCAGPGPKPP